jgi:hypothetical protein
LKVIDLNGKLVLEKELTNVNAGIFSSQMNIESIEKGTYLLLVETNSGFTNQIFIKD